MIGHRASRPRPLAANDSDLQQSAPESFRAAIPSTPPNMRDIPASAQCTPTEMASGDLANGSAPLGARQSDQD
jgi:hypothetical protein